MTSRTSLRSYLLTTSLPFFLFFFFNDTATTEIYTLSLHDALPISIKVPDVRRVFPFLRPFAHRRRGILGHSFLEQDRKSTRLNSSHGYISYAVFCLKKKKHKDISPRMRAKLLVDLITREERVICCH